jgi:hypothetical protein
VGGQRHSSDAMPPGETSYPFYMRLGGPRGPVWAGAVSVAVTGIRSPESPVRISLPNSLDTVGPMIRESSFKCRVRCTVQAFNSWHIASPGARYRLEGYSVMFIPYIVNSQLATLNQQHAQCWSLIICIISHCVFLNVSVHKSSSSGNRTKAIPKQYLIKPN